MPDLDYRQEPQMCTRDQGPLMSTAPQMSVAPPAPPLATSSQDPSLLQSRGNLYSGQYDNGPNMCVAPPAQTPTAAPPAPANGLAGNKVVPDDFVGPLAPGQIRQSQYNDLQKYGFDKLNVVGDDFVGPLNKDQMTQADYARLQQGWLNMNDGRGMALAGSDADKGAFKKMLSESMGNSAYFRNLLSTVGNNDPKNTVTFELGRNQAGLQNDAFEYQGSTGTAGKRRMQTVDLDDVDMIPGTAPAGQPDARTRTQLLIHSMTEAQNANLSTEADAGKRYDAAHHSAIDAENAYRDEQGQKGHRRYVDPETTAGGDWKFDYGSHKENWKWDGTKLKDINYN